MTPNPTDRERLQQKARRLYWHWAEMATFRPDIWSVALRDVIGGLRVGRLTLATSPSSWEDIVVPEQEAPEKMDPAILIGLVVAVVTPTSLKEGSKWTYAIHVATTLASQLREELPRVAQARFKLRMADVIYYSCGGREPDPILRMFDCSP